MALSGPFLAGMSVHAIDPVAQATTTRTEGDKPRTSTHATPSNGRVYGLKKGQEPGSDIEHTCTSLEMSGMGAFHGMLIDRHVP